VALAGNELVYYILGKSGDLGERAWKRIGAKQAASFIPERTGEKSSVLHVLEARWHRAFSKSYYAPRDCRKGETAEKGKKKIVTFHWPLGARRGGLGEQPLQWEKVSSWFSSYWKRVTLNAPSAKKRGGSYCFKPPNCEEARRSLSKKRYEKAAKFSRGEEKGSGGERKMNRRFFYMKNYTALCTGRRTPIM